MKRILIICLALFALSGTPAGADGPALDGLGADGLAADGLAADGPAAGGTAPACVVGGTAAARDVADAACAALAVHLGAANADPRPLRLVLTRAQPAALAGNVERSDGSRAGPEVEVRSSDGPLSPADIDHFARTALTLFLSR